MNHSTARLFLALGICLGTFSSALAQNAAQAPRQPVRLAESPLVRALGHERGVVCSNPKMVGFTIRPMGMLADGKQYAEVVLHRAPADADGPGGEPKTDFYTPSGQCAISASSVSTLLTCLRRADNGTWPLAFVLNARQDFSRVDSLIAAIDLSEGREPVLKLFPASDAGFDCVSAPAP